MSMPTVYERVAAIIGGLDNYTNVVFLPVVDGWGGAEREGIVRDMPRGDGSARRVTMIGTGSEFFVDAESLERVGLAGLKVMNGDRDQGIVLVAN